MSQHMYRIGAVAVLAFGAFATISALQLGFGSLADPGPGLWPAITSGTTIFCGLVLLFEDTPDDYEAWSQGSGRVGIAFVALGLFIPALQLLGIIPAAFALMLFWIRFLAREPWLLSAILAVTGSVGLFFAFGQLLGVRFPVGIIGRLTGLEIGF